VSGRTGLHEEREHLSVADARSRILGYMRAVAPERRSLLESLGHMLASDVVSPINLPPFDQAAMDGFAIRVDDASAASSANPVVLTVVRTIAAGDDAGAPLAPGTCCRIMTGAMLPVGATAVIELEWDKLRAASQQIVITESVAAGRHVRRAGEQVDAGATIARSGELLTPARAGLLAAAGVDRIAVCKPRIALIATGKELIRGDAGTETGIHDALSPMLTGYIAALGGEVVRHATVGDDPEALRTLCSAVIRDLQPDLLLTTAGISVGDHDVVRAAFAAERTTTFASVRMKPGQPLAFGLVDDVPFIGLPGNPLAAAVSFLQFGAPAVQRLAGADAPASPGMRACAAEALAADRECDRVICALAGLDARGELVVRQAEPQRRQSLATLAAANCLVMVPRGEQAILPGDLVEVVLLPGATPVVWTE